MSRVLDAGGAERAVSALTAFADVERACVVANVPFTQNPSADRAAAEQFVDGFFHAAVCDANGRPLAPAEILAPRGQPSGPTPPGTCR